MYLGMDECVGWCGCVYVFSFCFVFLFIIDHRAVND